MCITGADVRAEEESMVWDILCDECATKADFLIGEREACSVFDIPMEKYSFCPE